MPKAFVADMCFMTNCSFQYLRHVTERKAWELAGLDPTRQAEFLDLLGNRAVQIPWDNELREKMRAKLEHVEAL